MNEVILYKNIYDKISVFIFIKILYNILYNKILINYKY